MGLILVPLAPTGLVSVGGFFAQGDGPHRGPYPGLVYHAPLALKIDGVLMATGLTTRVIIQPEGEGSWVSVVRHTTKEPRLLTGPGPS